MALFLETFTGSSLDAGWGVSSNRPAGVTVGGGTLNFTAVYDPELATDNHTISRGFNGDLGGGYVKFWVTMPVVVGEDGSSPYLYVELQSDDPFRFVTLQIFKGNPAFHPIGDHGYTIHFTSTFAPVAAENEYHPYDAASPYLAMMIGDGTVTYQKSADGITYTTISTLTAGTVPWGSSSFGLLFNAYESSGWWAPPTGPWTMNVDSVAVSYTALDLISSASARWNVATYDLAGDLVGSAARFSPVSR